VQALTPTSLATTPITVDSEEPLIYNRAIYHGADVGFTLKRREDDGSISPNYVNYVYSAAIANLNGTRDLLYAEITRHDSEGMVDIIFRSAQLLQKVPIGRYRFSVVEQKPNGWKDLIILGTWDVEPARATP
jgi:hypothetical protein